MGARRVVYLALGLALASCTIERTRQLGDDCLMDRECASGLRCQSTSDGTLRCVAPARFDVTLIPGADATGDAPAEATAPTDASTPQDASAPDAPRDAIDVSDARDATSDVADAPDASDVADASDASDVTDASDADANDA